MQKLHTIIFGGGSNAFAEELRNQERAEALVSLRSALNSNPELAQKLLTWMTLAATDFQISTLRNNPLDPQTPSKNADLICKVSLLSSMVDSLFNTPAAINDDARRASST
jgi:hypothetical protein